ncbi:MAG: Crp/Fnr family transcriptional regulator [Melioribacteraceae bacterium]|nr:Crp/Fnr family transcriptional regulator [Melioribacteraceae bacterium]MCF8413293.1 Crp/Fnr family transcriptional regulator [Melioribacteraceae bacterium]MCF8430854.1 Crp/Fnr family transcriptional regulator [Melioribacteraceae bacterium]
MADKTKLWYLENFNLFKGLKMDSMKTLDKIAVHKELPKNQPIYFANEPSNSIFFLKKGRVKLTRMSPDGKELIIALVNPGEVFGEMVMVDEGERSDFATAIEPAKICAITKDDFKKFVESNPVLNLRITKLIGFKLKKYSERIEELVFRDAEQRVVSFILNMAKEYGKKVGDEYFVKPFLTHQNIAELTACSRQTVNSVLTDLREKKIINFDRKKLIIHDEKKLAGYLD